jgi:hypothetical protein
MPTLEELLRASLKGANEKYDNANKALHAAVVDTAKAVESATKGKATVRLNIVSRDAGEIRYELRIVINDVSDTRSIANFAIGTKGFPILRYEDEDFSYQGRTVYRIEEKFESAEAISNYFKNLVSDPDSSLVGYLAFIIRNLDSGDNSGDNGDPIPF